MFYPKLEAVNVKPVINFDNNIVQAVLPSAYFSK